MNIDIDLKKINLTSENIAKVKDAIKKGSSQPNKEIVGSIKRNQLEEIAKTKLPDLNTQDLDSAIRIVRGTANNMGIKIQID